MPLESRITLKSDLSNKYSIKGQNIVLKTYMIIRTLVGLNGELNSL